MEQEADVTTDIQVVLTCTRIAFKSQRKGIDKGNIIVNVDNLEQFKESIFEQVFVHGHEFYLRAVNVVTEGDNVICSWSDHSPTLASIGDWIMFNVPTSHRPSLSLAELTEPMVIAWKNKLVNLYITAYSNVVSSASVYGALKKQLIDPQRADTAGADANSTVHDLALRLRLLNPTYQAEYITYYCWANDILSKPAHRHQELINQGLPNLMLI